MNGRRRAARVVVLLVLVLVVAACSGESGSDDTTLMPTTSQTTATPTPTSPAGTTDAPATSTTGVVTTSTTVAFPTTTVHADPAECDVARMLAAVDAAVELARLEPGEAWETDATTTFDDRTNDAEEFRDRLALDCRLRAVQRFDTGDRLLVAAWTGARHAFVVQSADGPASPYAPDQRLQLLFEQPLGEWLAEQEIWAGSLEAGDTVIVGVDDSSLGAAAKAWQALPRWEDIPVSNETERYAIDVILHAGGRNVSPAEPATVGSSLAAIQFVTPLGLPGVAVVAPTGLFDHTAPIVEGERTIEIVEGVEVHVTTAAPESYAVASVGWACGEYVWFIDVVWGTVDELVDWAAALISAATCG